MTLKTPLAQIKGLGSAKSGTIHWMHQRGTAIILVPLTIWFVYSLVGLIAGGAEIAQIARWLSSPMTAVFMALFTLVLHYHAALGMQVIIEDYIHQKFLKFSSLIIVKYGLIVSAIISILSIIKLHLAGGA